MERNTIESIGGLNESLPLYYSDVDLCLNVRATGLRIVQAVDAQLFHFDRDMDEAIDPYKKIENRKESAELMKIKWGEILKERYLAYNEIFAQYTKIAEIVQ